MPVLSTTVQSLVKNARFNCGEMAQLERLSNNRLDAEMIATRYVDTLEAGVGSWLNQLLQRLGSRVRVGTAIANLSSEADLLAGRVLLPDAGRKHPSVLAVQKALIALASRTKNLSYMLLEFGADGDYGNETVKAVREFQRQNGLVVDGKVGQKTAQALDRELRRTRVPGITQATLQDIVSAANELCTPEFAKNYDFSEPWVNLDPRHNAPVGVPIGVLRNVFKCNLFGGNVLRKGGFEPPYYRNNNNSNRGEYANANQWYKWSDRYAASHGNPVRFKLVDEVKVTSIPNQDQQLQRIRQLLAQVKPGEFVMVGYPGDTVINGGHTRVCVSNEFATNGTVSFAQASSHPALVRHEGADVFLGVETVWLLRPNTPM